MSARDFGPLVTRALDLVPAGGTIGLGTGHAATAFVRGLGERVKAGLKVVGVPTSEETARLATELGIPLVTLDDGPELDIAFDGADEVAPSGDLVKGYGGALIRERVVAASARRFVVLVGDEKLVPALGTRGKLPVEIVPFARGFVARKLAALGLTPAVRTVGGAPFRSDNGNLILDCGLETLDDPQRLDKALRAIPGVVGSGLFLGLNPTVLVLAADGTVR
jgi:ribose 5-phosphate isomerase A